MKLLYNWEAFKIFLGAFLSLVVVVLISYIKSAVFYYNQKEGLKKQIEIDPNKEVEFGDIDDYLQTRLKITAIDINDEIVNNAIQPLLIVVFINFFDSSLKSLEILLSIIIILFSFFHEFVGAKLESKKWIYRTIIILLWLIMYALITYRYNSVAIK